LLEDNGSFPGANIFVDWNESEKREIEAKLEDLT